MQDSTLAILGKALSISVLMTTFGNKFVALRVAKIKPKLFQRFHVTCDFQIFLITLFGN